MSRRGRFTLIVLGCLVLLGVAAGTGAILYFTGFIGGKPHDQAASTSGAGPMQPFRGPGQPPSNKWPSRDPSIIGKEDWQVHESEEGHFSLLLPTEPVDLKTRLGAAWMAKTADVTVLLVSGPLQEADKGKDAKSLLKERADKDLTILKNLQLQGQPGIEMTDAKGTRLVRNYLITGWYFNIVVDTTPRVVDRKLADKIFDSFELR